MQQRHESSTYTDIGTHALFRAVPLIHPGAFLVRDHLQGQFIVIAQENTPLATLGQGRGGSQDFAQPVGGFFAQCGENARHDREVEADMALGCLIGSKVGDNLVRRLVRLGNHDGAGELFFDHCAQVRDELVRGREVFAVRTFFFEQVGDGIQPEAVHTGGAPKTHHVFHGFAHRRVFIVQVRLV